MVKRVVTGIKGVNYRDPDTGLRRHAKAGEEIEVSEIAAAGYADRLMIPAAYEANQEAARLTADAQKVAAGAIADAEESEGAGSSREEEGAQEDEAQEVDTESEPAHGPDDEPPED